MHNFYCVADYMSMATVGNGNLSFLILAIAALPYAWSYCQDKESGFLDSVLERVGIQAYSRARVVSVAASAFLAVQFALLLFAGFLLFQQVPATALTADGTGPYTQIAAEGNFLLYYFVRATLTGLTCGLAAEFGLAVTVIITNVHIAFIIPLLGFYAVYIIQMILWELFSFNFEGMWIYSFFGLPFQNRIISFFWSAEWILLLTVLSGWYFCKKLRKETGK